MKATGESANPRPDNLTCMRAAADGIPTPGRMTEAFGERHAPPLLRSHRLRRGNAEMRIEARLDLPRPIVTLIPSSAPNQVIDRVLVRDALHQVAALTDDHPHPIVRTPALTPGEADPFLSLNFSVRSQLALLTCDITDQPRPARRRRQPAIGRIRSYRSADLHRLLELDVAAFPASWGMDHYDFELAQRATPITRIRVIEDQHGRPTAFSVTGRAGRRGYLQRLSVDPSAQGQGFGTVLVHDAIAWSRRHRVRRLVVNTQHDNHRALRLYRTHGFVDNALGLVLLERADARA